MSPVNHLSEKTFKPLSLLISGCDFSVKGNRSKMGNVCPHEFYECVCVVSSQMSFNLEARGNMR